MAPRRRYLRLRSGDARERERELAEEIESHIAERAESLVRGGETPERALALARERFGDRAAVLRSARALDAQLRRRDWLGSVARDARLAVRHALGAPGATLLTVLTYALGIGLTVAMFALVNGVLLRPLPFPEPDRLVALHGQDSVGNLVEPVSLANWRDWGAATGVLAASALHVENRLTVGDASGARHVSTQLVTRHFFDVLQPRVVFGRTFDDGDMAQGSGALVVSEGFWRGQLGGRTDPDLTVEVAGMPFRVVGVIAAGQEYPAGTELWTPLPPAPVMTGIFRNYINFYAIGRLQPGVTAAAAEAELSARVQPIRDTEPESDYTYGVPVVPLHARVVGNVAGYLELLMGAVVFVLLLACANLAALNLARASRRDGEVQVRYALGAARGAVIRQLLTEHLVLALIGGAFGVLFAGWAAAYVAHAAADQLPRAAAISLDARVAAFAVGITLLAGVLAGLAPSLRASRASTPGRPSSRGVAAGGRGLPGGTLVAIEVALAVMLLTGAGLLVRSFQSVLARDVGFVPGGVASAQLSLTGARYREDPTRILEHWAALLERVAADPEIETAALVNTAPAAPGGRGYLVIEGGREDPGGVVYRLIEGDYFRTLGIPLLLGRAFDAADVRDGRRVAVISRAMAERHWPGQSPLGRQVQVPGMEGTRDNAPWLTIVGVAGDIRHAGLEGDDPTSNAIYVSITQAPRLGFQFDVLARARSGRDADATRALRRAVLAYDPGLAVEPESLPTRLHARIAGRRFVMSALSVAGALALVLAAIGIYGQLSFAVAQRAREIGVRAALGARPKSLVALVVRSAAAVVIPGALVGALLAWWLTRLVESMLVDVTRTDAFTYTASALLLVVVAVVATIAPAVRAARTDPVELLRGG